MTVPDHTPFLTKDCLRTAADVVKWQRRLLEDIARSSPNFERARFITAYDLTVATELKINSERVQACRRGAQELTRSIARQKLWLRSDYEQNKGAERFGTFAKCMAHQRETRWGSDLRRALAFRAAAREG